MKRFTDTDKWRDEWFMDLSLIHKAAWQYVLDRCDSIGHWKQNFRLADFEIGESVDWNEFLVICGDRIHVTKEGYWFVVAFVDFQYGVLKESCRPHQSYIRQLKERNLHTLTKGYAKGFKTLKEKETEKDMDKEKETDKEKDKLPAVSKSKARGSVEEIETYCVEQGLPAGQGQLLVDKWEGSGWKVGGNSMKCWRSTIRNWKSRGYLPMSTARGPDRSAGQIQGDSTAAYVANQKQRQAESDARIAAATPEGEIF